MHYRRRGAMPKYINVLYKESCSAQKIKCIIKDARQRPRKERCNAQNYKMFYTTQESHGISRCIKGGQTQNPNSPFPLSFEF
jgi:hypothetical protein